jgi:hypothetical protein
MINTVALELIDPSKSGLPQPNTNTALQTVLTDFFIVIGAIAFLVVVISGLQYITARGNPEKVTQAKNMLTYSIVGLVIASLAASIVRIVTDRIG